MITFVSHFYSILPVRYGCRVLIQNNSYCLYRIIMLHGTKCLPTNESHGFRFHSQQFTTQFKIQVVYHALKLHNIYGYPHTATLVENVIRIISHVLHCGEHALGFPVLRNHIIIFGRYYFSSSIRIEPH